jgi:hypothetical protein
MIMSKITRSRDFGHKVNLIINKYFFIFCPQNDTAVSFWGQGYFKYFE